MREDDRFFGWDYQRKRCYDWENENVILRVPVNMQPADVLAYVNQLVTRFNEKPINVEWSFRMSYSKATAYPGTRRIVFGTATTPGFHCLHFDEATILHEAAHIFTGDINESHGAMWLGIYVMLLDDAGIRRRSSMEAEIIDLGLHYRSILFEDWGKDWALDYSRAEYVEHRKALLTEMRAINFTDQKLIDLGLLPEQGSPEWEDEVKLGILPL